MISFRKYRYFNSLLNATHPIQIHRAVLEKLRFEKRIKNFNLKYLWNLWTNHFAQRTRPRTIKNLALQRILKRLNQFYSRNRWTYKTRFFNFLIFFSKTNQKNGTKFSQIIAIYILHYHDFSPKNWPSSLGVISLKKKKNTLSICYRVKNAGSQHFQ